MAVADRYIAQKNMILGQLLPNRITDKNLLDVIARVPRKMFVPEAFEDVACIEGQVPLGYNRYLMAPTTFATLLTLADIKDTDNVLDVACATGYSTAIISHLARKVTGLEVNTDFASKANTRLSKLHIENGIIVSGNLSEGHSEGAPFDVIVINGCIDRIPEVLLHQLAPGGRLVTVFRENETTSSYALFILEEAGLVRRDGDYAVAPMLQELCQGALL